MIFVTGGTGFLGAHLLYRLVMQGEEIIALKRKNSDWTKFDLVAQFYQRDPQKLKEKIQWVEGDLSSTETIFHDNPSVDTIFHVAAKVSFHIKDRKEMYRTNVLGTRQLIDAALVHNIKRFCFVSSIAAIGRGQKTNIDENTEWKDDPMDSYYGKSKHLAELEVWRGAAEGLKTLIVNPGIILGPGELNSGSTKMVKTVIDGLRFYPAGKNGFIDVRDVVEIMLQLMRMNIHNQRYILVAKNLYYKELFDIIAEMANVPAPSVKVNRSLAYTYYYYQQLKSYFTGDSPVLTKETMRTSMNIFHYSNEKINSLLAYKFIPVEQTISDIAAFASAYIFLRKKRKKQIKPV